MKKILLAVASTLFVINSEAMFSGKNKNIPEAKKAQNLTICTYPRKINNLTEVRIAGDGSCGYGALLLATYFESLSKGYADKVTELQEVAVSAINGDNNPARKYLLQKVITALNAGDARANFVKFLITSTVKFADKNEREAPSLEECIDYLKRIRELPRITEEKDWLRFHRMFHSKDIVELVEKTIVKSSGFSNLQNVLDVLETLHYAEYVGHRFALFDAIAYVLESNFCLYNNNSEVVLNRNFGFENQINVRYVEEIHFDILLSDSTLLCLNEYGIAHAPVSWGNKLFLWIHDKTTPAKNPQYDYDGSWEAKIIKTKDEKYFFRMNVQYSNYFCNLELGIGLTKILQGHEQEGREIVRNTIRSPFDSQKRLLEKLADSHIVRNFIAESNEISIVNKDEAIDYLNMLYAQKNLNKIGEIILIHSNLTTCFYDPNDNTLYKSNQDNSTCDLNIKFLGSEEEYVNLIPINQIKFFKDKNVFCKEYCIFNTPAFFK